MLVGDAAGKPRYDFKGKLPAAWPKTPSMADGALYPFGYGLTYKSPRTAWKALPEVAGDARDARVYFAKGVPASSWSLVLGNIDRADEKRITTVPGRRDRRPRARSPRPTRRCRKARGGCR